MKFSIPFATLLAMMVFTAGPLRADTSNEHVKPVAAAPAHSSDVYRFKIGDYAAFALKDGDLQIPNDGKVFGLDHTPADVADVLRGAGLPTDNLSLSIEPLLVKADGKVLLFDTGAGKNMGPSAGKLSASLATAGVDPASITDIFISHVHGDHVGGLIDAEGKAAFPNATIHLSAPEWDFLKGLDQAAAAKQGIVDHAALMRAITPKVAPFAPSAHIIPGVVKAVQIEGHTPGHSGYLIGAGKDSLLFVGDTVHHFVVSVQKPEWYLGFDDDKITAAASRVALLKLVSKSGERIYAGHFPFPGLGKFESKGASFVWIPE